MIEGVLLPVATKNRFKKVLLSDFFFSYDSIFGDLNDFVDTVKNVRKRNDVM